MANPASITVTACVLNGSVAQPAAQTIDTDGIVPITVGGPSDRMIIEVVNSAAQILIVKAKSGANPPSLAANGDMAVSVAASTGKVIIGPFESARFMQADGKINIDFKSGSGSPNAAIRCYRLPKN